ncbi:DUF4872 domain-containing protein [Pseudoduganella sp. FT93W]|uniref:DUF4872 domain-containing protein n=1 Tax=Duganella fentianensis TaxID=2692177 RepID=A0A845HXX1_9BURK|nr:BtrH N-terminal domain-containing protein [Duganella fentianensis]MYN46040.1 DUF4872 domain-containing protein [Duganella fentianensis]
MTSMLIPDFQPYKGAHCETVATGSLLKAIGIDLSEPMLFGLGEGLSFVFLNLATLPLPFIGGRVQPFDLTTALCQNLGVVCHATETSSRTKAWINLEKTIHGRVPVGLQLDAYYLDYFSNPFHFAGHFVAVYGIDSDSVWVVDTTQQGTTHQVARRRIEEARFARGPMAARARSWTITRSDQMMDLPAAIRKAIRSNAAAYLTPAFKGASHLGIRKLSTSLPKWLQISRAPDQDLAQTALLMEKAGTGGSLFRNFYRDFLIESLGHLDQGKELVDRAAEQFGASAHNWAKVAELIQVAGEERKVEPLREASIICKEIAELEVAAMRLLAHL